MNKNMLLKIIIALGVVTTPALEASYFWSGWFNSLPTFSSVRSSFGSFFSKSENKRTAGIFAGISFAAISAAIWKKYSTHSTKLVTKKRNFHSKNYRPQNQQAAQSTLSQEDLDLAEAIKLSQQESGIKDSKMEIDDHGNNTHANENTNALPIKRLPVTTQENSECGMHAAINAIRLLKRYHENPDSIKASQFQDDKETNEYLARFKPWVVNFRRQEQMKKEISDQLITYVTCPSTNGAHKIKTGMVNGREQVITYDKCELYRNRLNGIADGISNIAFNKHPDPNNISELYDADYIKTLMTPFGLESSEGHQSFENEFKRYLPRINNFKLQVNKKYMGKFKADYQNIDSGIINMLLKKEIGNNFDDVIAVADDITSLHPEFGALNKFIDDAKNNSNMMRVILKGTMSETNVENVGHWNLWAIRKKNDKKKIYVADSLYGADPENNPSTKQLAQLFNK